LSEIRRVAGQPNDDGVQKELGVEQFDSVVQTMARLADTEKLLYLNILLIYSSVNALRLGMKQNPNKEYRLK
jgi:hypothetical protein